MVEVHVTWICSGEDHYLVVGENVYVVRPFRHYSGPVGGWVAFLKISSGDREVYGLYASVRAAKQKVEEQLPGIVRLALVQEAMKGVEEHEAG